MKFKPALTALVISQLCVFGLTHSNTVIAGEHPAAEHAEEEVEKGPNRGRMLRDGNFALELAIFETGVPPEFRVFATKNGQPLAARDVKVNINLTRLGGVVDKVNFRAENNYLRGDMTIYEPHSFVVSVQARYQGKTYSWQYDNFEGRTHIAQDLATAMDIETDFVGAQTLTHTLDVFGNLALPADAQRKIFARFDGEITRFNVRLGEQVQKGQILMTIQSNDSLQSYNITSPTSGVITAQMAGLGEQTAGRELLEITDHSKLMAELKVFPANQAKVITGAKVAIKIAGHEPVVSGTIKDSLFAVSPGQARIFRVEVANPANAFLPGQFVEAKIDLDDFDVPLAVNKDALQSFRDFTVVYAKVGDQYEVRMLELGRQAGNWVEVLGGIDAGTEYVTTNSYIIKADIDKSGASHDH